MEEDEPTRTEVLEVIGTYLITPLWAESFLDIIKNTCRSSSSLSFSDEELQCKLIFISSTSYQNYTISLSPRKFS